MKDWCWCSPSELALCKCHSVTQVLTIKTESRLRQSKYIRLYFAYSQRCNQVLHGKSQVIKLQVKSQVPKKAFSSWASSQVLSLSVKMQSELVLFTISPVYYSMYKVKYLKVNLIFHFSSFSSVIYSFLCQTIIKYIRNTILIFGIPWVSIRLIFSSWISLLLFCL